METVDYTEARQSQHMFITTVCLKKKTSPTFLAVTRESIVGFS